MNTDGVYLCSLTCNTYIPNRTRKERIILYSSINLEIYIIYIITITYYTCASILNVLVIGVLDARIQNNTFSIEHFYTNLAISNLYKPVMWQKKELYLNIL